MRWLAAAVGLFLTLGATSPARPQVVEWVRGLEIPWSLAFAPDGRAFVTERPGRVRVVRDGRVDPQPAAILPVAHVGEGGLLGIALHPRFPNPPYVYLYYTYQQDGLRNRVERFREQGGRLVRDRVVVDDIPGAFVHDGGRIRFGPDGMLYVGTGDARQPSLAQDPRSLAGKILRVTPDGGVPADNPFPGSPVYSLGHRNVQGLAWHPQTRRLYSTEHGPSGERGFAHDEVNLIRPGANYGWPEVVCSEGSRPEFVDPLACSGDDTWAPSGAEFVRRGSWRGRLLVANLRGAHLRAFVLSHDGSRVERQEVVLSGFGRLRDVVEGPDGAVYVLTSNRDGRGRPADADDRILRLILPQ
ncbi:MAG: PQQ-dependent sugar dehydrogenase [Armatimonadota bacterium]|nr:PQQ-dependent sugar dehydrogenase [Armatimonadota bacterium]MDW8155535.1 PQQ-dependent sugar dehydrogenase [Armatimonadota bacterium]